MKLPGLKFAANVVSLLLIFSFLLVFFPPQLILSNTTTTGGDMGSHFVPAHYLKNYLMPHGKLIGWYPHWMAGTPMLQFYFVPPYLLMAVLSIFIPLEISFKLVTILGVFLLPLTTFFMMRFLGFEFPTPAIASGFTTLFLFLESHSQWGGNIPSTLAGEFSYMLSFSLTILLMGSMYLGVKRNMHVILNSVLLAMVVLTHIYTAIFITLLSLFFLLVDNRCRNFIYLLRVFSLAGLISGFWTIPLIAKLGFSAAPKDVFFGFPSLDVVIVPQFTLFYILAAVSVASGILGRDRRILYFLWAVLSAIVLILSIKYINLLYVRFVPFTYFIPLLMASDGLGRLSRNLKARWLFPIIVVLSTLIWVNFGIPGVISEAGKLTGYGDNPMLKAAESHTRDFPLISHGIAYIPHWIKWNYEGLEEKNTYGTFLKLNDYLRNSNLSGRVDFEYSNSYNKFGTPRVFEASPVFSNRSVLESLLLESSLTFPFFYYIQKEVSEDAWWPGFPLEIPGFNPKAGADDLRLYNVKYFVASSSKVKNALADSSRYRLIEEIDEFNIYLVNEDSAYVEALDREPVLVVTDNWKKFTYDWISMGYKDVPLVFTSSPDDYDLGRFRIIVLDKPVRIQNDNIRVFYPENITQALESSREIGADCTVTESLREEEILVDTTCINRPLIVKVSYFPNWMVEGAGRIYIASPSLMLIFPERERVRIYYGETLADGAGNISSIIGFLIVFYWLLTRNRGFRERVHGRLLIPVRYSRLEDRISLFRDRLRYVPSLLKSNWRWVLLVSAVSSLLLIVVFHLNEQSKCSEFCLSRGFSGGGKVFRSEIIDRYSLGYNHKSENQKHNFECTAICDESRGDMVYVSNGYVQFDLSVVEDADNKLFLKMFDNVRCRSGDLYLNNIFVERVEGTGKFGWHDFEFKIPGEFINSSKITVKLEHSNLECYGWDLSEAYIHSSSCKCYE